MTGSPSLEGLSLERSAASSCPVSTGIALTNTFTTQSFTVCHYVPQFDSESYDLTNRSTLSPFIVSHFNFDRQYSDSDFKEQPHLLHSDAVRSTAAHADSSPPGLFEGVSKQIVTTRQTTLGSRNPAKSAPLSQPKCLNHYENAYFDEVLRLSTYFLRKCPVQMFNNPDDRFAEVFDYLADHLGTDVFEDEDEVLWWIQQLCKIEAVEGN
jgi:hypothetical protein